MDSFSAYQQKGIIETISNLNKTIFLPDLQRAYEWEEPQILKLFDSVLRGYPINTFLMWEISKEKLQENKYKRYKFVDCKGKVSEEETTPLQGLECVFVLDGQQRLTTLNLGVNGYIEKRGSRQRLYFNILSGKTRDDEDLLFEFRFFPEKKGLIIREENKKWIPVYWLVSQFTEMKKRVPAIASELVPKDDSNHELVYDNMDRFNAYLINGKIYYYSEKEPDEDRVLDIFIRTNSGGTKLGYSELLFSKIKVRWRSTDTDARQAFTRLVSKINEGGFDFDNDFILKSALVCKAKNNEDVKFKLSNFDNETVMQIEKDWERLEDAIKATRDLMYDQLYLTNGKLITSYNALIPLVSYAFTNELNTFERKGSIDLRKHYEDIREYTYKSLITGAFGSQVDTTLWNIQEIIIQSRGSGFPTSEITKKLKGMGKVFEIQKEVLEKITYGGRNSHATLNLIYNRLNLQFTSNANQPQQDHIFSRDELKHKYPEDVINDIANIRLVTSAENNWKSNITFIKWVATTDLEERGLHLIPEGDWSLEKYPEFLSARRELILQRINASIQKT